jgi:hypothetical protein
MTTSAPSSSSAVTDTAELDRDHVALAHEPQALGTTY